jgi:hypothetical protein
MGGWFGWFGGHGWWMRWRWEEEGWRMGYVIYVVGGVFYPIVVDIINEDVSDEHVIKNCLIMYSLATSR